MLNLSAKRSDGTKTELTVMASGEPLTIIGEFAILIKHFCEKIVNSTPKDYRTATFCFIRRALNDCIDYIDDLENN